MSNISLPPEIINALPLEANPTKPLQFTVFSNIKITKGYADWINPIKIISCMVFGLLYYITLCFFDSLKPRSLTSDWIAFTRNNFTIQSAYVPSSALTRPRHYDQADSSIIPTVVCSLSQEGLKNKLIENLTILPIVHAIVRQAVETVFQVRKIDNQNLQDNQNQDADQSLVQGNNYTFALKKIDYQIKLSEQSKHLKEVGPLTKFMKIYRRPEELNRIELLSVIEIVANRSTPVNNVTIVVPLWRKALVEIVQPTAEQKRDNIVFTEFDNIGD